MHNCNSRTGSRRRRQVGPLLVYQADKNAAVVIEKFETLLLQVQAVHQPSPCPVVDLVLDQCFVCRMIRQVLEQLHSSRTKCSNTQQFPRLGGTVSKPATTLQISTRRATATVNKCCVYSVVLLYLESSEQGAVHIASVFHLHKQCHRWQSLEQW